MLFKRIFLLETGLNPFIGKTRLKGFAPIVRIRAKRVDKVGHIGHIGSAIWGYINVGDASKVTVSTL